MARVTISSPGKARVPSQAPGQPPRNIHASAAGSPADPDQRWRPRGRGPVCGYTFRDKTCEKSGPHYCEPRADKPVAFFAELLVHTKGPFARQRFVLSAWEEHDVIRPVFGEVVWSSEWQRYIRRYRIVYIVVARKNGKSELVAGIVLYLLVSDDEEAAEVYGAAKDTKQAGKVAEPAHRMVQLSPRLKARLKRFVASRRIVDEKTASYFEVLTSDAEGELGHNPHGFYLDEVISQPDGKLWTAMRTAAGARVQPLYLCMTTETDDGTSFGGEMIDEADRMIEDPKRAPHVFAFVRKAPRNRDELKRLHRLFPGHPDLPFSLDWADERNWRWPNPALDDFLSRSALRDEALEAANEPAKLNAFLQFRLNQRVQQTTRYIPLDLWDDNAGPRWLNPTWRDKQLHGKRCWGGLDLSSRLDLTAWCLLFDDGTCRWRYWCPESVAPKLNDATGGQFGQWVKAGWVTLTDGDAIDYERVYQDIEADHEQFSIINATYDKWSGEPVRQEIETRTGLEMFESDTTYTRMTVPMKELMRLLHENELCTGGNPVSRWMADCVQAKTPVDDPERIRPVKPKRDTDKRIDGIPALLFAIDGRLGSYGDNYDLMESVR